MKINPMATLHQGCQIFLGQTFKIGTNIPNDHKQYQRAINYTKWPKNIPNGHKEFQHLLFKGPPKFTQIWNFWFENKPSGNPVLHTFPKTK
jgi:hypothetical protein